MRGASRRTPVQGGVPGRMHRAASPVARRAGSPAGQVSAPDGLLMTPPDASVAAPLRQPLQTDLSLSATVAGLVAVLVSFGGTAVLMVQAGLIAGLDAAWIGSWLRSICLA